MRKARLVKVGIVAERRLSSSVGRDQEQQRSALQRRAERRGACRLVMIGGRSPAPWPNRDISVCQPVWQVLYGCSAERPYDASGTPSLSSSIAACGWPLHPFLPLYPAVRLPGAQRRACPEQSEGAMQSLLRLGVRSWRFLRRTWMDTQLSKFGTAGSFPLLPIPCFTRFRVNGSHDAGLGRRYICKI